MSSVDTLKRRGVADPVSRKGLDMLGPTEGPRERVRPMACRAAADRLILVHKTGEVYRSQWRDRFSVSVVALLAVPRTR